MKQLDRVGRLPYYLSGNNIPGIILPERLLAYGI